MGAAKVNNLLEMGFWQRMGAGSKGKKNLWRWNFSEGWVLAAKVRCKDAHQGLGAKFNVSNRVIAGELSGI